MIGSLICVASAVLVLPVPDVRQRCSTLFGEHEPVRESRIRVEVAIALGCVPAMVVGGVSALIAAVVLAATLLHRRRRSAADRARQAQRRGLLDGLEIVIAELGVGAHPSAACASAAAECSGVAADAFAVASARSRLGGSGADGLRVEKSSIAAELGRIASAWQVAEGHGIALAELLEASRQDLVGRLRFRSRTESSLAGARATAAVLAGLPLLGILLGQMMGASPLHVLLGGGLGGMLLVIGTGLACAGLLWTDAITGRVTA